MANVSYTTKQAITTPAQRAPAYERIANMFLHLDALDLNLVSLVRNGDGTITATFDKPMRADQIDHLGF